MSGGTAAERRTAYPIPDGLRSSRRPAVLMTFQAPVQYATAWTLQQHCHAERRAGNGTDTLLLLEHLPVYTAGRATKPSHLSPKTASFNPPPVPIVTVNRGGSVTYHGPGQLVAYPIVVLSQYAPGAKAYVHMLEEVLIRTLRRFGIQGYRVTNAPGVWLSDRKGEAKVASIGARIDRGVTLHGFALNVTNDLRPFSSIVPCGLDRCRMTSLVETTETPISMAVACEQLANEFSAVFQVDWTVRVFDGLRTTANHAQPFTATEER